MKPSTIFWAIAGIIGAAAAQASPENPSITTTTTTTTTAVPEPSCTATLLTTLCDYPPAGPDFAVASSGREFCWEYCQQNGIPCNFIIFVAGNPNTGTGTCWVYPDQAFDASKGEPGSNCSHPSIFVYDKPTCVGGAKTPADSVPAQCSAAVASPSPLAALCDYPTPPNDCRESCTASDGASECLTQCARADACAYVVFRAGNPTKSPYASGTCWMYPEGSYDSAAGEACSAPQLYVYNNTCPRPSPTKAKTSAAATSSATGNGQSGGGASGTADAAAAATSHNAAPTARVLGRGIVLGAAVLAWNAL